MPLFTIKPSDRVQKIFSDSAENFKKSRKAINRILMVGALLEPHDSEKLDSCTPDNDFLLLSAYKAKKAGFSFDERVQIDVCNLNYGSSAFDLSEDEAKADIVIFCNLYYEPQCSHRITDETQQDPKSFDDDHWIKFFEKTQSRLVVNTGFEGRVFTSLPNISKRIHATELFRQAGKSVSFNCQSDVEYGFSYGADFFRPKNP